MKKLAIISTHPIQYNAPLFRLLSERKKLTIRIFYTWGSAVLENKYDPGFGKHIAWDIPLLGGYEYSFVNNIAPNPGSHHFKGIDNPTLIDEVKNWGASAVLVYGWSFKSHLKLMRYFHGKIPVLFRGDSISTSLANPIKNVLRNLFLRWIYKHVDVAFYVGTKNKNYFKKNGLLPHKLIFAPHAVDNQRFIGSTINRTNSSTWRNQLGISDSDITILFVGKFEPKKDPQILKKAFFEVSKPGLHLIYVGNGVLESELKDGIVDAANIHFIDFQNQQKMPEVYALADLVVLPSKGPGETWGLAINEAMAAGKAVLVSDACGCAEDLVEDSLNGYIFKHGDVSDLVNKLKILTTNKDMLQKMGTHSADKILNWSLQEVATSIEKTCIKLNAVS